jgi:hypothetical protein
MFFDWGVEMESVEAVVAVVTSTILACHEEAGRPRAGWVKLSEVTHLAGIFPAFLVEEIRKELAMAPLVLAEVPGVGFLLLDPAKFTDAPTLWLKPSIHQRRGIVPAPE